MLAVRYAPRRAPVRSLMIPGLPSAVAQRENARQRVGSGNPLDNSGATHDATITISSRRICDIAG